MAHSRKDMSDTVTDVLLSACAPAEAMPGRLLMEHVLLVSILHRTVGIEVGLSLGGGCPAHRPCARRPGGLCHVCARRLRDLGRLPLWHLVSSHIASLSVGFCPLDAIWDLPGVPRLPHCDGDWFGCSEHRALYRLPLRCPCWVGGPPACEVYLGSGPGALVSPRPRVGGVPDLPGR